MESDDKKLVELAKQGDHAAFRALVERHGQKVYAMALSVLRDPSDAKDAVQDAFLKAYTSLKDFHGESGFYTWVYRIAMNLCIDRARRAKRFAEVEFDEKFEHDESAWEIAPSRLGFDPQQAFTDGEIRARVSAGLEQLSPNHRLVLVLREVEGLSYKEIADQMGVQIGTVMSRLFHARKRMQEMLRPLVQGDEAPAAEAAPQGVPEGAKEEQ